MSATSCLAIHLQTFWFEFEIFFQCCVFPSAVFFSEQWVSRESGMEFAYLSIHFTVTTYHKLPSLLS